MPAPNFKEWFESDANPLKGASIAAVHFTAKALQLAFIAGAAYNESLHEKRGLAKLSNEPNIFESR